MIKKTQRIARTNARSRRAVQDWWINGGRDKVEARQLTKAEAAKLVEQELKSEFPEDTAIQKMKVTKGVWVSTREAVGDDHLPWPGREPGKRNRDPQPEQQELRVLACQVDALVKGLGATPQPEFLELMLRLVEPSESSPNRLQLQLNGHSA